MFEIIYVFGYLNKTETDRQTDRERKEEIMRERQREGKEYKRR